MGWNSLPPFDLPDLPLLLNVKKRNLMLLSVFLDPCGISLFLQYQMRQINEGDICVCSVFDVPSHDFRACHLSEERKQSTGDGSLPSVFICSVHMIQVGSFFERIIPCIMLQYLPSLS